MNWHKANDENPDHSVHWADDDIHTGHRYVCLRKRGGTGMWRLAHRANDQEPLRIIYVGLTLKECKTYAEEYRDIVAMQLHN